MIIFLVPLHNACSYGHYEVAELLVKRGANVNATDLWKVWFQFPILIDLHIGYFSLPHCMKHHLKVK